MRLCYSLVVATINGSFFVSVAIDQLNANLLRQSQRNLLAGQRSQTSSAFFHSLDVIHNFRDHDAFLFGKIFASDAGKRNGFVDALLDGLRVGNFDSHIDGRDNRYIVSGFLGNLFAVFAISTITSVSMMSMVAVSMVTRLTDSDHLDLSLFFEGNLNSLGGGVFVLLLVGISADFLRNLLNGFGAHSAGDSVAHLLVHNTLDGQIDIFAGGHNGGSTDLSLFSHILDSAVVLGLFITISMMMSISRGMVVSRGGVVDRSSGFGVVFGLRFVSGCRLVRGGFVSGVGVVSRGGGVSIVSAAMVIPVFLSMTRDFDKTASVGQSQRNQSQKYECLKKFQISSNFSIFLKK